MKKQTAMQLLKETLDSEIKLGTKMVVNWDMYLQMERQQHGKTWDAALKRYDERGGNYVRAWEDFDDYFDKTYKNSNNE